VATRAICYEVYDHERVQKSWVLRRAFNNGNIITRISVVQRRLAWLFLQLAKAVIEIIVCFILSLMTKNELQKLKLRIRIWGCFGKLSGIFGFQFPSYQWIVGR
jgi:hypothetical protein